MAGSLRQSDTSGNDGLKISPWKNSAEVGGDLTRKVGAVIVHCQQNAFDGEVVLEGVSDPIDSVHQLRNAL